MCAPAVFALLVEFFIFLFFDRGSGDRLRHVCSKWTAQADRTRPTPALRNNQRVFPSSTGFIRLPQFGAFLVVPCVLQPKIENLPSPLVTLTLLTGCRQLSPFVTRKKNNLRSFETGNADEARRVGVKEYHTVSQKSKEEIFRRPDVSIAVRCHPSGATLACFTEMRASCCRTKTCTDRRLGRANSRAVERTRVNLSYMYIHMAQNVIRDQYVSCRGFAEQCRRTANKGH